MEYNFTVRETEIRGGLMLSVLLWCAAALAAVPASAQIYDEQVAGAEAGEQDSGCVPACRAGFACRGGTCVSPCNPPCAGGEVCTRGGLCLPASPPAAPAAAVQPAPGVYVVPPHAHSGHGAERELPDPGFDIDRARRKKAAGAVVMSFGLIGIVGAGVLGFVSGLSGETELLLVGLAVEALSLTMFIPGLVSYVKNKKLIERHERKSLSMLGLAPLATKDSGGLALAVGF
jgi:hypothetical protein